MDIVELLDEFEQIIDEGVTVPLSAKVLVDRDKILGIIDIIRDVLPKEIKQAQRINEEKNRILIEAQGQAELMVKETEERIMNLIEEDEITKKAYQQAEEIIENAKINAREIRLGTKEYADNLLAELERRLESFLELISKNREEVRNMRS